MSWYRWKWWLFAWSINADSRVTDSHRWHRVLGHLMVRGARYVNENGEHPEQFLKHMECSTENWSGPKTIEDAQSYHAGFIAGLTVYARESGQSTLKSNNELLRRLMDEQGWETVETMEKICRGVL